MNRAHCLFVALVLAAGCSGRSRVQPSPGIETHWRALKSSCKVGTDSVNCDKRTFRDVIATCIETGRHAQNIQAQLDSLVKTSAVDLAAKEAEVQRYKTKAEDPWRSPWLWFGIGAAAGTAVGVGVGLGTR